jgi:hypothetical protein
MGLCLALATGGCGGKDDVVCMQGQIPDGQGGCMSACPSGQSWNGVQCVAQTQCPAGQQWTGTACACPAGQQWNGTACACPAGQQWNGTACAAAVAQQCPPGQQWNGTACVAAAAAGACAPAQPIDAGLAGPGLDVLAQQHMVPGARPTGLTLAGNFQQGQCLEVPFQLDPGKCYTIVGMSLGGITNLDLELKPAVLQGLPVLPGFQLPPAASDTTAEPTAVIGPKPNCYKWPLPMPMPMTLVMRVSAGQGMAAARVYAK